MSELDKARAALKQAREQSAGNEAQWLGVRAVLAGTDRTIGDLERRGRVITENGQQVGVDDEASAAIAARIDLARDVEKLHGELLRDRGRLDELERTLRASLDPRTTIERLGDDLPFLLMPIRTEIRFFGRELRIRCFPDDFMVQSHEAALTSDEADAGRQYWRSLWGGDTDEEAAFRALAERFDPPRSRWIVEATRPLNAPSAGDGEPEFGDVAEKEDSWTAPPRAKILPDRFVFALYRDGERVHQVLGAPIPDPLPLGPDPLAGDDDLSTADGDLDLGPGLRWLADFDAAEDRGMAVRVPISDTEAADGFDRLIVLGIRYSLDPDDSRSYVESLLTDHRFAAGIELLPQGTPTNNTVSSASGYDRHTTDNVAPGAPTASFEAAFVEHEKSDGQRLCDALGIGYDAAQGLPNSGIRDLSQAEAMNGALFPGTLGYYMEQMLGLDADLIKDVRRFFSDHVRARGALPALRVGALPEGVLLTTAYSALELSPAERHLAAGIPDVISRLEPVWRDLRDKVARIGADNEIEGVRDAEATLLDVLGLHATSAEFHVRNMVGPDYTQNLLGFLAAGTYAPRWSGLARVFAGLLFRELGYEIESEEDLPPIFDMRFFQRQWELSGPLVQDGELSETEPLAVVSSAGDNYIGWLRTASFDDIREERFGSDTEGEPIEPPKALLYLLLRHSLLLEYWDTASRLGVVHGKLDEAHRAEVELMNMGDEPNVSRWDILDLSITEVSGNQPIKAMLEGSLDTPELVRMSELEELRAVKAALAELEQVPTAALERLLVEHIDLLSYRIDAWKQGLLHQRLLGMRGGDQNGAMTTGLHLGAFGWLEDLRPRPSPETVADDDAAVLAVGGIDKLPGAGAPVKRPDNGGHIHSFSIDQAKTAALLHAGYLNHRGEEGFERLATNLTSKRVQLALSLLTGMQSGVSLGELLGYRFERSLHDLSPAVELDQHILEFRQAYPLIADDAGADEASRQVLDGARLVEAARESRYPWSVPGLPAEGSAEADAIVDAMAALDDALDAVSDVGVAESVYQVVKGNFERSGAMLDAIDRGGVPPQAEVIRTPRGGMPVTHRIGLVFDADAAPAAPWPAVPMTARARFEPRLNAWLANSLPGPDAIKANVRFIEAGAITERVIALNSLGLQPLDLVIVADVTGDTAAGSGELEQRLVNAARIAAGVSDSAEAEIRWMDSSGLAADEFTFYELSMLLDSLRELLGVGRPMNAEDLHALSDPVEGDRRRLDVADLDGRLATAAAEFAVAATGVRDELAALQGVLTGGGSPAAAIANARSALMAMAAWGMPDAVPLGSVDHTAAAGLALVTQLDSVVTQLEAREGRIGEAMTVPADESPEARLARLGEATAALFGGKVPATMPFTLHEPAEFTAAAQASADLLSGAPRGAIGEWLESIARVREPAGHLNRARVLGAALVDRDPPVTVLQLPHREGARWAALPLAEDHGLGGDTLSLALETDADLRTASRLAGLLIDEWVESIPSTREITGLTFHYDQPDSEPPQSMLLVVPAQRSGRWDWEELEQALHDTLEDARTRAVEPDQLQDTLLDQLIPAITPPGSRLPATIGVNLFWNVGLKFSMDLEE